MTTPAPVSDSQTDAITPVKKTGDCRHRYVAMFSIGAALLSFGFGLIFVFLKLTITAIVFIVLILLFFVAAALADLVFCRCQFEYPTKILRPTTQRESGTLAAVLVGFICIWVPMAIFKPTQIVCLFLMAGCALFAGYKMISFASRQGRLVK